MCIAGAASFATLKSKKLFRSSEYNGGPARSGGTQLQKDPEEMAQQQAGNLMLKPQASRVVVKKSRATRSKVFYSCRIFTQLQESV